MAKQPLTPWKKFKNSVNCLSKPVKKSTMVWLSVKIIRKKTSKSTQQRRKNLPTLELTPMTKKLSWFLPKSCQLKKPSVTWETMSCCKSLQNKSEWERKNSSKAEETESEDKEKTHLRTLNKRSDSLTDYLFFFHILTTFCFQNLFSIGQINFDE